MSNFGNSCKETQIFSNFGPKNGKIWQVLSRKCQIMGLFNVEILKLWVAHPYLKFSQEPPVGKVH